MIHFIYFIFAYFLKNIFISKEQDNLDDSFILNVCNGNRYCYFEPEDTYKDMRKKKKNTMYTLTNCKVSAFDAQQAGFSGQQKMPGHVLMG
ncbi:hypothetical protein PTC90_32000 (plasmid) [Klebsiella grimontii]|uniref:hypothetical protein n=1 Tax=Klebsiella grimontii TaxID=2058152 RepID=UPI0023603123|nr:hypothetical protein [Klebsiella grimontii]WDC46621.1 hypothetical protein PTC90_32000 [Klebsiella grimontii]